MPPRSYVSWKIALKNSNIHGVGMFAQVPIEQGEVVFIKGGHIIGRQDVFSSGVIASYLPIDDEYFIGALSAEEEAGVKLWINHSCDPNCGVRGEITFVALRRIDAEEEITIDYAMVDNEEYEFECHCGRSTCRRKITGFDWRIEALQDKYSEYFARYLQEKIRGARSGRDNSGTGHRGVSRGRFKLGPKEEAGDH